MKIIFSGPLDIYGISYFKSVELTKAQHKVIRINLIDYFGKRSLLHSIERHLLIGRNLFRYNLDLLNLAKIHNPDLIYIDQAFYVFPSTLNKLKKLCKKIVHDSSEYFGFHPHRYRYLFESAHLYDYHIITNDLNIPILTKYKASNILKMEFGYIPNLHKPLEINEQEKKAFESEVLFIGHWEPKYEQVLSALIKAKIKIDIFGPNWTKSNSIPNKNNIYKVYGNDYVKRIQSSKICLGILSGWNKNTCQGRTFEIPAIGSFLITERTMEQCKYFSEGTEAEFYSSSTELIKKINCYLLDDEKRKHIALNGKKKCIGSNYSLSNRFKETFSKINL